MFVRQKIDYLGKERMGRLAGKVEDRNLSLILGGSVGGWEAQKRPDPGLDCLLKAALGYWSAKEVK